MFEFFSSLRKAFSDDLIECGGFRSREGIGLQGESDDGGCDVGSGMKDVAGEIFEVFNVRDALQVDGEGSVFFGSRLSCQAEGDFALNQKNSGQVGGALLEDFDEEGCGYIIG
jgi:hypothetical protein